MFAGFAVAGFWWFAGLAATRARYQAGVASRRPYGVFLLVDVACLAIATGPAIAIALGRLRDRRLWWLVGSALTAVGLAGLSGMAKGEVERIWLPFSIWLLPAGAALGRRAAPVALVGGAARVRDRRADVGAQPVVILVTGGAGFIGSLRRGAALRTRATRSGCSTGCTPARTSACPPTSIPRADWRWGDCCDAEAVARAVDGVDAVCHQAAMVGLGVDLGDAPGYVRDNDLGTAVLLAALHERDFTGRLVLASSMVVYGEGRYRCATHGDVRPRRAHPHRPRRREVGAEVPGVWTTLAR